MGSVGFSAPVLVFLIPSVRSLTRPDTQLITVPDSDTQCCECHRSLFETGVVHLSVKDCQKHSATITGHCFSLRLYRLDSDVPRERLAMMEMRFCCRTYNEMTGDIHSVESFGVVFNDSRGVEIGDGLQ